MIEVMVRGIRIEAQDIRSFELVSTSGPLPDWEAGAHVQVEIRPGLQRAYSLCNHPEDTDCYRIAVKRDLQSRGGSQAMHSLQVGQRLRISSPANLFALNERSARVVLLAAGIGITPLYAMYVSLLAKGIVPELHVFAHSADHLVFGSRITGHAELHLGLSREAAAVVLKGAIENGAANPGTDFYVCGPSGFMDAVVEIAVESGIPADHLHSERFAPAEVVAPGQTGFMVRFARSGVEASVPPGSTIIEVARSVGVEIPTSCEMGVCGACLSNVLEGTPDHQDSYLTPEEQAEGKTMLPCVSRCCSGKLSIDR